MAEVPPAEAPEVASDRRSIERQFLVFDEQVGCEEQVKLGNACAGTLQVLKVPMSTVALFERCLFRCEIALRPLLWSGQQGHHVQKGIADIWTCDIVYKAL